MGEAGELQKAWGVWRWVPDCVTPIAAYLFPASGKWPKTVSTRSGASAHRRPLGFRTIRSWNPMAVTGSDGPLVCEDPDSGSLEAQDLRVWF